MKRIEIYAFVGWVTSFIIYIIYLIWAIFPEEQLQSFGVYYYPHKSWSIAIPCAFCMTILFVYTAYQAINMINTFQLDNKNLIEDSLSRKMIKQKEITNCLPEIHDIPIGVVNNILYYQKDVLSQYNQENIMSSRNSGQLSSKMDSIQSQKTISSRQSSDSINTFLFN